MSGANEKSTALEVIEAFKTDLTGYDVIITGANSGIGVETARALAKAGARCVITGRDMEKAEKAVNEIKQSTGNSNIEFEKLELDSLESVNEFVKNYLAKNRPLHILINNAGIMACPLSYTKEGLEMQWGANHLGHFALTMGLLPALKEAAKLTGRNSRVINLASSAHARSDVDFNDINFKNRPYDPMVSYGQSKTANILFTVGLNNRYANEGVVSNSVMPGFIATNLQRNFDQATKEQIGKRFGAFEKSIPQGAATTVWASVAPEFENKGGLYLENCSISILKESAEKLYQTFSGHLAYVFNPESVEKLWNLSEQILKEHIK